MTISRLRRRVAASFATLVTLAALAATPHALVAQDATLDRVRRAFESDPADRAAQVASVKADLATWVKANPRRAEGAYWMGRVHIAERDWGKAADWLEKAVELDPTSAPAHYWLGGAYGEQAVKANKLRQPFLAKKVRQHFERAVALDPDYIQARLGLLDFYRMAPGFMGGGMDKARAQAAEIRKRDPLRGAYAYASIALAEKKWDVAAQEYERAIAAAPDSTGRYVALADLHGRQGKWDEAWAVLGRFRARRPDDPRAGYYAGRLAATSGERLDEGEAGLRRYLVRQPASTWPSHAAAHWRLGQVLERRGDATGARREYEAALRLDPTLAGAKESLRKLGG